MRKGGSSMTDEALLAWIERGQVIATFLVAIGVAAEFVGTFMSRPIQQRIDRARELEIAQLRKQTEDERLARVKIEEKLAARR